MWRFIVYLFPVLANMFAGGMFFISAYRFSEAGSSKLAVTGTMAMWAVIYSLGSLVIGRLTTAKRAPWMLIAAGLLLTFASLGFVVFPSLSLQYLWIALVGVGMAGYCTPFQVFAKDLESGSKGGVVRTTSLYTVAWSLGFALGSTVFGMIPNWRHGFYLNAAMSMVMVFGVLFIMWQKTRGNVAAATEEQGVSPADGEYAGMPDCALVGWIGAGIGTTTIAALRTLEPNLAVELGIGKMHGGLILALVSYMQVFLALLFIRTRRWMYMTYPLVISGLCGMAGLVLLCVSRQVPLLYVSTFLYGIFSGVFYFVTIFHSQVHPTKNAQYVATNEAVVGIVSVVGSIGGGAIAESFGLRTTFGICVALILFLIIIQILMMARLRKKAPLA